jgi:hypothetical protein
MVGGWVGDGVGGVYHSVGGTKQNNPPKRRWRKRIKTPEEYCEVVTIIFNAAPRPQAKNDTQIDQHFPEMACRLIELIRGASRSRKIFVLA